MAKEGPLLLIIFPSYGDATIVCEGLQNFRLFIIGLNVKNLKKALSRIEKSL
jgi:hypothetical protein